MNSETEEIAGRRYLAVAVTMSSRRELRKLSGKTDHVAGVEDLFLAKATYDAACKRWPGKMIILPHRPLVLEEAARHGSPYGRMLMRRMLKAVFLNAMLAIAGNDVRAQGVRLPSAFITGQAFAGLPENARTQYVTGLVDGIFVAVLFGASQGRVSALERCLGGQDNKQIGANLLKYIQERPGEQREGAHVIFYRQMIEVCPGAGPAQ